MINITDEKGNPLGLDYDYEYRGTRRERYRNWPYYKSMVIWLIFFAVFVLAGIVLLIKEPSAENIPAALLTFALSGIFLWLLLNSRKKHRRLLRAIHHE